MCRTELVTNLGPRMHVVLLSSIYPAVPSENDTEARTQRGVADGQCPNIDGETSGYAGGD